MGDEVTWTTTGKELAVSKVTGHLDRRPSPVRGRAPAVERINFTPVELYGAMARCSHLHMVNADAVTAESETCRYLLSQYVDERQKHFAILKTADRLKDFSRTHLAGVVGAGIAYLQMIRDGYVWCDHFENLALGGSQPTKKSPDFVFSRREDETVALTESKSTRGSSRPQFDGTVRRGYLEQVSPYLGMAVGTAVASHGFAIGSWMTSSTSAEIFVHHTASSSGSAGSSGEGSSDPTSVRRGNYLNAMSLLFGSDVAAAARSGRWTPVDAHFVTGRWLGREWLLGFAAPNRLYEYDGVAVTLLDRPASSRSFNGFALDWAIARRFLRSLLPFGTGPNPLIELPEIDARLIAEASRSEGAIFPDGFAVISNEADLEEISVRPLGQITEGAYIEDVSDPFDEDDVERHFEQMQLNADTIELLPYSR